MIFLISDFLSQRFENELKFCSHRNDLVAIQIIDPAEIELPRAGKVYVNNPENDRFLVIIQALTIWINAKNLGVACGEEIPDSIRSYIAILREYF